MIFVFDVVLVINILVLLIGVVIEWVEDGS